jgi:hypothetical protein
MEADESLRSLGVRGALITRWTPDKSGRSSESLHSLAIPAVAAIAGRRAFRWYFLCFPLAFHGPQTKHGKAASSGGVAPFRIRPWKLAASDKKVAEHKKSGTRDLKFSALDAAMAC